MRFSASKNELLETKLQVSVISKPNKMILNRIINKII